MDKRYPHSYETNEPIVRAAYSLALKAHGTQARYKADPDIKYISHTIMVVQLLEQMKVVEPSMLAAGFLHDSLEDYPPYAANPEQLRIDFTQALLREGVDAARVPMIVKYVYDIVKSVTSHPDQRKDHKRVHQIDAIAGMSGNAKIIKIADQTASIIDNMMLPNDQKKFGKEKEINFARKADNLVTEILNSARTIRERASLARWVELFRCINRENWQILHAKTQAEADEIRAKFNLGEMVNREYNALALRPSLDPPMLRGIQLPLDRAQPHTLAEVDLDAFGNVRRFVLWVAPGKGEGHARNQKQIELLDLLEKKLSLRVLIGEQRGIIFNDKIVNNEGRMHRLKPHLPLEYFLRLAQQAGVVGHAGVEHIRREAKRALENGNGHGYAA